MTKELDFKNYLNRVFVWMMFGLTTSAVTGYFGYQSLLNGGLLFRLIFSNRIFFYLMIAVQIGIVLALSVAVKKISTNLSRILFIIYAMITGLNFSTLPVLYGINDIFMAFGGAAILFMVMVILGKTTKADLTKFGGWFLALLITYLIIGVINYFMKNPMVNLILPYLGVAIFMGLTAYDIKKIKQYYEALAGDQAMQDRMVINGALELYLDFINIFLNLVRIFGSRD